MKYMIALSFLGLLVFSSAFSAKVYKCADAQGNLLFSDTPCKAGSKTFFWLVLSLSKYLPTPLGHPATRLDSLSGREDTTT